MYWSVRGRLYVPPRLIECDGESLPSRNVLSSWVRHSYHLSSWLLLQSDVHEPHAMPIQHVFSEYGKYICPELLCLPCWL